MKEPEISTRITEIKSEFETENEIQLARFDSHGERLMSLNNDFGFDLDVATDIYGDRLINPLKAEELLEKWEQLLSEIHNNPGGSLLLVRPTRIPAIIPQSGMDGYTTGVEVALAIDVEPSDLIYVPENPETNEPAHIAITSDTKIYRPGVENEHSYGFITPPNQESGIILAQHHDTPQFLGLSAHGIGEEDVQFIYNPSWREAHDLIKIRSNYTSMLSSHFLDPLRHK